jgi:hypothetical protein
MLCVPLCSARREEINKSCGIVHNILINISFIFIFPYSSRVTACILLEYFTSKVTHKRAKQGERGNGRGNQARERAREREQERESQKPIHPLERISSTHARSNRKQVTDVISALSSIPWCTDSTQLSQNMSSKKFPPDSALCFCDAWTACQLFKRVFY